MKLSAKIVAFDACCLALGEGDFTVDWEISYIRTILTLMLQSS
jgi:hypothetical protein